MPFTPKTLSQRDPQWTDEKLGFDETHTIGSDGCALACLTMLVNGYCFSETPSSMNRKLKELGSGIGFLGGLIVWPGLTRAFPKIAFQRIIVCRDSPAPMDEINHWLDSGRPLVIEIARSPSPGLLYHWVVLYARQGDDYLMLDPWSQPPDTLPARLLARYGFGQDPDDFITAVAWYDTGEILPPAPAPGTGLYVLVQDAVMSGLRLRSSSTDANTIAIEPPGTRLLCLEPESLALPKIGVINQWLNVRDPGGVEGFVAAWYVEKEILPAPAPTPAQKPVPTPATTLPQGLAPTPAPVIEPPSSPAPSPAPEPASAAAPPLEPSPGPTPSPAPEPAPALTPASEPPTLLSPTPAPEPAPAPVTESEPPPGRAATPVPESAPAPAPTSAPAPSSIPAGLSVLVSQSIGSVGMRLRDGPSTNSNTLVILSAGAELTVLEPADQASPKIGQVNQWLYVRDENGNLGYVAAWYVRLNPAPSLASTTKPLTVLVSSQASAGLRLRDRPSVYGNILEVLMPGTLLVVLEPASTAQAKIGVVNQWLNVKLPGGMAGYVAAWYLTA